MMNSTGHLVDPAGGTIKTRLTSSWHRFSIRQVLLLMALIAVLILLLQRNTRTDRAINSLKLLGAKVEGAIASPFRLTCEGTHFGDEHLSTISQLKSLKGLSLAKSRVTDSGLAKLLPLEKLEVLDLSGTKVSVAGLQILQHLGNLRELHLRNTAIGSGDLDSLACLKSVVLLSLAN